MTNRYTLSTQTGHTITAGPLALVAAQAAALASTTTVLVDDGTHVIAIDHTGAHWLKPQELFPPSQCRQPPIWLTRLTTLVANLGTTTKKETQTP